VEAGTPARSAGPPVTDNRAELQRGALESVLASASFDRSRSLSKLLNYICTKYFDGQADEIKEYSVAVEALGRPADFDPKKDAIVRVEMHRLRKRLREYYADRGAKDPVQIALGEKGYVPEFIFRSNPASLDGVTGAVTPSFTQSPPAEAMQVAVPEPEIISPRPRNSKIWIGASIGLALLVAAVMVLRNGRPLPVVTPPQANTASESSAPPAKGAVADASEIRLLAGRGPARYSDHNGHLWEGDRFFQGGDAILGRSDVVTRGFDRNLFGGMREGGFEYAIPLKPGAHEMELFFAETMFGEGNPLGGGEGSRVFEVRANGKPLLSGFDVVADAGGADLADSRVFRDIGPGSDGLLHLRFEPQPGRKAFVNAVVIRPGQPGRLNPIRIVARPQPYRDANGTLWLADRYYQGGIQISRPTVPYGLDDAYVFQGERYGTFTYTVPVAPGTYQATLYFWEYWWGGNGHPGNGGVGSRRFDVYCNFKPLLKDFDIIREGGQAQTVKRTFHGLTPNAQGKLVFAFDPKVNYAQLNAIEIVDETPK
jgi:hypothetical protein